MRDVVIVPCYERPFYTKLCLEYLRRARGVEDKEIWIFIDNHIGRDFGDIFNAQQPNLKYAPFVKCQEAHNTYGNSQNLIDGLRTAYNSGAERIFLVEDDIMVSPDIFEWHEAVLANPYVFVSCATALNKSAHFHINGPQVMDESFQDPNAYSLVNGPYSSHAVAFHRTALRFILEQVEYEKPIWKSGWEQDIFIQTWMKRTGNQSAWPYVPRAYNVGWRSYHINTGVTFNGTLEEKVRALDAVIHDPIRLREMSAGNQAVSAIPEKWPERTGPVRNVQKFR